jgi:ParB/RepB/Spo0J family partition protein
MHIDELKQHPRNTETFRDLTGEEFEELKASISDHGIIEPVIVNQDGIIICGHQRVRACRELGINDVPVVVREVVSDEEHETLLIEENLRRRQLTVSETARAVKRLYELRGIDRRGGDVTPATVAGLASELGKSERTLRKISS